MPLDIAARKSWLLFPLSCRPYLVQGQKLGVVPLTLSLMERACRGQANYYMRLKGVLSYPLVISLIVLGALSIAIGATNDAFVQSGVPVFSPHPISLPLFVIGVSVTLLSFLYSSGRCTPF